jgi:uncharacterized membrane protein
MDMVNLKENNIHRIFVVSLILKGFDSVLEIIGGVLFLFTGSVTAIITFKIVYEEKKSSVTDEKSRIIQAKLSVESKLERAEHKLIDVLCMIPDQAGRGFFGH